MNDCGNSEATYHNVVRVDTNHGNDVRVDTNHGIGSFGHKPRHVELPWCVSHATLWMIDQAGGDI